MGLRERVSQLVGGGSGPDRRAETESVESSRDRAEPSTDRPADAEREPSHVCRSCGEEYFTDPGMEIRTCRECGGVKVEPA